MSTAYIIGIVFRWLNFFVLMLIVWKLIKRYVLPVLHTQMHAQGAHVEQLQGRHRILINDIRDAERALIDDRSEQEYLKERVNRWKDRVEQERTIAQERHKERSELTQKRLAQQMKQINTTRLLANALPNALVQARNELRDKFKQSDAQEGYINRLTTRIKGL